MRSLQREPGVLLALLAVIALVLAFIVYPQVKVLLTPGGTYVDFFVNGNWKNSTLHSLEVMALSTTTAVALGFVFAYAMVYTDMRWKPFFRLIGILPLLSPPFVVAASYVILFGPRGLITYNVFGASVNIFGLGGIWVAWLDQRNGGHDVYAQHVLASGLVDPCWPTNGTPVCTAPKAQTSLGIVGDGVGGVIVTWTDTRSGNPGSDIFAQHVLRSGVVDPAWPINGLGLCTAPGTQAGPRIISDDAAGGVGTGAIVAWTDTRDGTNEIFAQRVLISAAIAPGWPTDGRAISIGGIDEAISRTPVRRVGRPEDIANAYAWLASDEASFVTGHCLSVDGGVVVGT